jgi:hypothetical protein
LPVPERRDTMTGNFIFFAIVFACLLIHFTDKEKVHLRRIQYENDCAFREEMEIKKECRILDKWKRDVEEAKLNRVNPPSKPEFIYLEEFMKGE